MVLTSVSSPAAGAFSEIGDGAARGRAGLRRGSAQPRQFLVFGDRITLANEEISDLGAFLVGADHGLAARHDKSVDADQIGKAGIGGLW